MLVRFLIITLFTVLATSVLQAQKISEAADSLTSALSDKYLNKVDNKISALNDGIEKKTLKMLKHLEKQEARIQKKVSIKDSVAAQQLFSVKDRYKSLTEQIKNPLNKTGLKEYIPEFDSLKTSLSFLNQSASLTEKLPKDWSNKLKNVNTNVADFESRLQQANEIKRIIKERRQQLKEQLDKIGLGKELKKMNKQVYYYQQQLSEYKTLLKDRKKIEQKAMAELQKLPAFTAFMKKNSQLAQLFRLPDNYGTPESLAGLQTRASVQNQIQARFASSGVNPQQYIGQQMQVATAELSKIKDKLNKMGGGSSDDDLTPALSEGEGGFRPNSERTKSFLKRIEYGANVQSQKTNMLLPVTSDAALTAGYKLNDKSVIGIGASYKLGWGSGWKNIKLTNQGLSFRSYLDVKLKGSFWVSGGYEQNYQRGFTQINQLKDYSAWQTSGLIGLSKKYKIGKKTNNLQLLWDFMSYQQVPRRQPIVFRVGYIFK